MNLKLYTTPLFLVTLGMTTSLSLPPFNYILVNFFTFTLFFLFLLKKSTQNRNAKIFFLYGWLFGFGYFVTNLYWISISLSFDQNFKFLIPFTVILIPAFLALFYGIVSYLFIILKSKKILSSFILFSLIFGIIEFIRGSIFTGFPWNLIVYSFSRQLEILSITSIIGTYGLNLFCISLFTSPSIIILKNTKKNVSICISFFIITGLFYFYGHSYKEKFYKANDREYEYKVRVIGSNINLDRFYLGADSNSIIKDLIKLSSPNKNQKTIFIWPEGILPNITEKEFSEYKLLFSNYFSEKHLLIIGVNNKSTKDGSIKYFNSLSIYNHEFDLIDTYNKINLVPFGEFLPFENVLKNIGLKSLTNNYQSFSSGNLREIIKIKKQGFSLQILPLICYEIIYSGKLISNPSYDLIVNISEDGWFGQSIGPQQHFDHSVLRAIENRKYILRSANNGIAAIINPLGIVEHSVDFGNSGYVELEETKIIQPTIFSIYGNKIFGLLILMYILLIFSFNKIRNE